MPEKDEVLEERQTTFNSERIEELMEDGVIEHVYHANSEASE